jgi:hemoglobin-like flavoprotein
VRLTRIHRIHRDPPGSRRLHRHEGSENHEQEQLMNFLANFWDFIWFFFWTFAFIAYLMVLFSIVADVFRDRALNGWAKAVWILALMFVPFLTALVYLIARGAGMAERQMARSQAVQGDAEQYIRSIAGTSSAADEIAKAKALHESGAITAEEYSILKEDVLGRHTGVSAERGRRATSATQ